MRYQSKSTLNSAHTWLSNLKNEIYLFGLWWNCTIRSCTRQRNYNIPELCVFLNFSFTALGSVEESRFKSRKKFLYEELLKEENIYSNRFRIMFKRKNNNPSNLICPKDLTALDKTKPRPPQNSKYCKWNNETVPNIFLTQQKKKFVASWKDLRALKTIQLNVVKSLYDVF